MNDSGESSSSNPPSSSSASSTVSTHSPTRLSPPPKRPNREAKVTPIPALTSPTANLQSLHGPSSRLQPRMGSISPEERPDGSSSLPKRFTNEKFVPKEELVKQIMDLGICRNGAVKALYWTGNHSALTASNWIFDQPDRDLDTPLEEELEMIRAQQREREREEKEQKEILSMCQIAHHHHHHHFHHHSSGDHDESFDDEDDEENEIDEDEMLEEDDEDLDIDEDEEEEEEEDEMDFKMVMVANKSLDLRPGSLALHTARATAGLFKKINSQPQSSSVGPDELSMWGELGERTVILWADSEQHIKDLELMAKSIRIPSYMVDFKDEGPKAVLGIFGEEKDVNKVTGRLKVVI